MGEQVALEFDKSFGDVLVHKLNILRLLVILRYESSQSNNMTNKLLVNFSKLENMGFGVWCLILGTLGGSVADWAVP